MLNRKIRWLYAELPALVQAGVLDTVTAARLKEHYGPLPESSARRMLIALFGVLGALLVGAGVVLILAHNWEELSRPVRAALALGLLLLAQGLAGWTLWKRSESAAWYEGASTFLVLAIAAATALVAQTYQIADDLSAFLLTWALLLLPIPYLLSSRVAAALYWVVATWWLTSVGWIDPVEHQKLLYLGMVAVALPFVVWLGVRFRDEARTVVLLWIAVACLVVAGFVLLPDLAHGLWLPVSAVFFGTLYVLGLLRHGTDALSSVPLWRRPLQIVGTAGLAVLLFAGSFADFWRYLPRHEGSVTAFAELAPVGAAVLLLAAFCVSRSIALWRGDLRHRALVALAPALLAAAWGLSFREGASDWLMLAVNVFGLVLGLSAAHAGFRTGGLGTANAGLFLVVTLVAARFFDEHWSFVARGVGFILLGLAFLVFNLWMLHRRREVQA